MTMIMRILHISLLLGVFLTGGWADADDDAGEQFLKLARPLSHRTQGQDKPRWETPRSDQELNFNLGCLSSHRMLP